MIANFKVTASIDKVLGLSPSAIVYNPVTGVDTGAISSSGNPGSMQPIYRVYNPSASSTGDSSPISSTQSEITQWQNQNTQLGESQSSSVSDSATLSNALASMDTGLNEYQGTLAMLEGSLGAGNLGFDSFAGSSISSSSLSGASSTAVDPLSSVSGASSANTIAASVDQSINGVNSGSNAANLDSQNGSGGAAQDPVLAEIQGALAQTKKETPAYVALAAANDPQNPNAGSDERAGLLQEEQNLETQASMEEAINNAEAINSAGTAQAAAVLRNYPA